MFKRVLNVVKGDVKPKEEEKEKELYCIVKERSYKGMTYFGEKNNEVGDIEFVINIAKIHDDFDHKYKTYKLTEIDMDILTETTVTIKETK